MFRLRLHPTSPVSSLGSPSSRLAGPALAWFLGQFFAARKLPEALNAPSGCYSDRTALCIGGLRELPGCESCRGTRAEQAQNANDGEPNEETEKSGAGAGEHITSKLPYLNRLCTLRYNCRPSYS